MLKSYLDKNLAGIMKAATISKDKLVISKVKRPTLTEKGAIIKVHGCGLCGSDIVKLKTGISKDGDVLGHEVVGEIVEIDSSTTFQVGDRIVLGHHVPCFDCVYCWGGNYSMCRSFKNTNIFPGGFAEYIFASELHLQNTAFIPNPELSDDEAAFLEPLACCIRAIKRSEIPHSSRVLIVGLGSIGLLMGQAAQAMGYKAIGCDIIPERVDLAKRLGFEEAMVSTDQNTIISKVKEFTSDYGADAVFMTSGSDRTLDLALKSIRDGGTIIVFSSIKTDLGYSNNDIYYRELKVLGSYSPAPVDLEDSLEFLQSRKVIVENLSTHYTIEHINEAIQDTITNKIIKAYITL